MPFFAVQKFSGTIKVETKSDLFSCSLNEIAKLYKILNSKALAQKNTKQILQLKSKLCLYTT